MSTRRQGRVIPCNLNQTEDSGLVTDCVQEKSEQSSSSQLGVFMGCSKEMKTSTPMRNLSRSQTPLYAPAIGRGEGTLCTVEDVGDHRLSISYESVKESSFFEVVLPWFCFQGNSAMILTRFQNR